MGLLAAHAAAADRFEVYRAQHRPADELLAIVGPLLGPDVVAAADSRLGAVVLRGTTFGVGEALHLLRTLDAAPKQFRVRSTWTSETALRALGVELSGWLRIGDLRLARFPATRSAGFGVRVKALSATSERRFGADLVVLEGSVGESWTGQAFPVLVREFEPRGPGEASVTETTTLAGARSGFAVRPRSIQGGIELEIAPIAEEMGATGLEIYSRSAATRVRLKSGEALVLAELDRHDGTREQGAFGFSRESRDDDAVIVVEAEILELEPR